MLPNEDGRRMIEFNHDDEAGTDVSKISAVPVIQAAIAHTHAAYQAAGHALVQASAVVVRETGETRQARLALETLGLPWSLFTVTMRAPCRLKPSQTYMFVGKFWSV